jgi:hypothetical protein
LRLQLPAHFIAGALRLGQYRAQALDLCITLLEQVIQNLAFAARLTVLAQQALVVLGTPGNSSCLTC